MKRTGTSTDLISLFTTRVNKQPAVATGSRPNLFRPCQTAKPHPLVRPTESADLFASSTSPKDSKGYATVAKKQPVPIPFASKEQLETLSTPDVLQEVHAHGHMITILIKRTKERIKEIDEAAEGRTHLFDGSVAKALINIKRIIGALENRLERLRALAIPTNTAGLIKAKSMIVSELVIPCDAINSLINAEQLPSLPPDKWENTIDTMLSFAEEAIIGSADRDRRVAY